MYIPQSYSNNMYVLENSDDPSNLRIYKLTTVLGAGKPVTPSPGVDAPGKNVWGIPTAAAPWFRFDIVLPPESVACNSVSTSYDFRVFGGEGFDDMNYLTINWGDGSEIVTVNTPAVGTYTYSHTYSYQGDYTVSVTAFDNQSKAMQGMVKTTTVKVKSCFLPVNPNTHNYKH